MLIMDDPSSGQALPGVASAVVDDAEPAYEDTAFRAVSGGTTVRLAGRANGLGPDQARPQMVGVQRRLHLDLLGQFGPLQNLDFLHAEDKIARDDHPVLSVLPGDWRVIFGGTEPSAKRWPIRNIRPGYAGDAIVAIACHI